MLNCWTKATFRISAYIMVTVNIISMVFATLVFAASVWAMTSPTTLALAVQAFGTPYMKVLLTEETFTLQTAVGAMVLAGLLFLISFMGLYGAVSCSKFLLFMYSGLVLLLLLLECSLMFYFSSGLVEKGLNEQDGQWTHALRLALNCCEQNFTFQNDSFVYLPWSCCGVHGFRSNCTASNSFGKDCQQTFKEWWVVYGTWMYVCLAVLHVVLSSCSLARRASSASRSHT